MSGPSFFFIRHGQLIEPYIDHLTMDYKTLTELSLGILDPGINANAPQLFEQRTSGVDFSQVKTIYYNNSGKCGRSHPWLTQEEFSDILNAWLVRKNGSDADRERILPTTINSCSIAGVSGDPFSISEMREKANALGGAYTSVSLVSVTYSTNGTTAGKTIVLAITFKSGIIRRTTQGASGPK